MIKRGLIGLSFILTFAIAIPSLYAQAASDGTPPVVESAEVLTKEVVPGGKVKFKVTASDDVSGIYALTLRFKSPSGNNHFQSTLWLEENGPLANTYTFESEALNPYAEYGTWTLTLINATDFARNERYYHASRVEDTVAHNISFTVDPNAPIEEIEIDDGFEAYPAKTNVELNKEFTIQFSLNLDIKTLTEGNIYVLDQYGNRVPLLFIVDREDKGETSKVTIAPLNNYRSNTSYTLYVKDVKSTTGQILSQNTKMNFTTRK